MNILEAFEMVNETNNIICETIDGKFGRKEIEDPRYYYYVDDNGLLKDQRGDCVEFKKDIIECNNWEVFGRIDHNLLINKTIPNLEIVPAFTALIKHKEWKNDKQYADEWFVTRRAWIKKTEQSYVTCKDIDPVSFEYISFIKDINYTNRQIFKDYINFDMESFFCNDWIIFNESDLDVIFDIK